LLPETIESRSQDSDAASWAGNLAKAVATSVDEVRSAWNPIAPVPDAPSEPDQRRLWVARARERLYPAGERSVRGWLRSVHFACELWKRGALDPDRQSVPAPSTSAYPEDLSPPALAGVGSYTELALKLIDEGFGPLRPFAELAPEELLAVLLLLDDARDCERGVRLAQTRLSTREAGRSSAALKTLAGVGTDLSDED
jgi:hypothetical protein